MIFAPTPSTQAEAYLCDATQCLTHTTTQHTACVYLLVPGLLGHLLTNPPSSPEIFWLPAGKEKKNKGYNSGSIKHKQSYLVAMDCKQRFVCVMRRLLWLWLRSC